MPNKKKPTSRRPSSRDVKVIATRRTDPDLRRLARVLIEIARKQAETDSQLAASDDDSEAA